MDWQINDNKRKMKIIGFRYVAMMINDKWNYRLLKHCYNDKQKMKIIGFWYIALMDWQVNDPKWKLSASESSLLPGTPIDWQLKIVSFLIFITSRLSSISNWNRMNSTGFFICHHFTHRSIDWKKRVLPWKYAHALCCPVQTSFPLNLLCVRILFQNASSQICYRFFSLHSVCNNHLCTGTSLITCTRLLLNVSGFLGFRPRFSELLIQK